MSGYPFDPKTTAFANWIAGADDLVDSLGDETEHGNEDTTEKILEIGFREGWDAAMVAHSGVEQAGIALAKFLEAHTDKLAGREFAAVWYPMQAALAKGGK